MKIRVLVQVIKFNKNIYFKEYIKMIFGLNKGWINWFGLGVIGKKIQFDIKNDC